MYSLCILYIAIPVTSTPPVNPNCPLLQFDGLDWQGWTYWVAWIKWVISYFYKLDLFFLYLLAP